MPKRKPKTVLSIDPGMTTGMAVFEVTNFKKKKLELVSLYSLGQGDISITIPTWTANIALIERPPSFVTNVDLSIILSTILHYLRLQSPEPSIQIYSPGDWKPVQKKKRWKAIAGADQHQKDAINIFRWWYWAEYKIDIGSPKLKKGG